MNERVAKSVAFLLRNPNASVSEAMAAVQVFSREECANRSLQQRVRRAHKKQCVLDVSESVAIKKCASNVPELVGGKNAPNMSPLTNPSFQSASTNNIDNNINHNQNTNSIMDSMAIY
mmetsp:Transcript_19480/g.40808  ORF Transcript_19480/g.40808 Transcript_19480/m.40808 type:complete len:118 (+) Transcript_19480:100-453(+)